MADEQPNPASSPEPLPPLSPGSPPPSPGGGMPTEGAPASAEAMAESALSAAQTAVSDLKQGVSTDPAPFTPEAFDRPTPAEAAKSLDLLSDVNLNVKIELGRTRMLVEDVLRLGEGAVVELDKLAGDPVDVYVNDRHIARGEVLVLNDNFCVRINEIIVGAGEKEAQRIRSAKV
jgi:flagellar motor switch protein FliN/FliY